MESDAEETPTHATRDVNHLGEQIGRFFFLYLREMKLGCEL